jgi:hypothetical protein
MVIEPSCSGTKNPRQLAAKARIASAATAPASRSFAFVDDISWILLVLDTPIQLGKQA